MALNEQSEFSKQCLTDALFLLLEHKSFQKITIKELTEKAGVSRLTFYRNFNTKEDILKRYYRINFSQYMKRLDETGISSINGALATCFDYWKNAENHIQLILDNHLEYFLLITKKSCFNTFLSTLFTGISLTLVAFIGFATRNTLIFVPFLFAIINFCSYLFFKSNKHKFPYYFHIGLLFLLTNNNVGGNQSSKGIVSIGIGLTVLTACIMVVRRKIKGVPFFNQQSYANYLCEKYKKLLEEDRLVIQRSVIHSGILFLLGWISYVVYGHRGYWLLLSGSAVLIGEDLGKIHIRGLRRIIGAGVGFLIAAIFVLAGGSKTGLIILYIAATVGAFMLMPQKYILGSACIGLQATAANAFIEGKMGFTILFERACWTIIGALITIALCYIADKLFKNLYCDYEKDSLIYHR